jgi:hypothetical protein
MTDEEKEEVKKMIKQAVDESTLRLRQEIVNARRELVDKIQALENKLNGS